MLFPFKNKATTQPPHFLVGGPVGGFFLPHKMPPENSKKKKEKDKGFLGKNFSQFSYILFKETFIKHQGKEIFFFGWGG